MTEPLKASKAPAIIMNSIFDKLKSMSGFTFIASLDRLSTRSRSIITMQKTFSYKDGQWVLSIALDCPLVPFTVSSSPVETALIDSSQISTLKYTSSYTLPLIYRLRHHFQSLIYYIYYMFYILFFQVFKLYFWRQLFFLNNKVHSIFFF